MANASENDGNDEVVDINDSTLIIAFGNKSIKVVTNPDIGEAINRGLSNEEYLGVAIRGLLQMDPTFASVVISRFEQVMAEKEAKDKPVIYNPEGGRAN